MRLGDRSEAWPSGNTPRELQGEVVGGHCLSLGSPWEAHSEDVLAVPRESWGLQVRISPGLPGVDIPVAEGKAGAACRAGLSLEERAPPSCWGQPGWGRAGTGFW